MRKLQPIAVTALVLVVIGVPLWLVVVTAGKSQGEALNPDFSLPQRWQRNGASRYQADRQDDESATANPSGDHPGPGAASTGRPPASS